MTLFKLYPCDTSKVLSYHFQNNDKKLSFQTLLPILPLLKNSKL